MTKTTDKEAIAAVPVAPRLGERISVKSAPERMVANNEAGDWFSGKTATAVTVTLRILRLLEDGDLIRTK